MIRNFEFKPCGIGGLVEVTPFSAEDGRGGFIKDYSREIFARAGLQHELKEVFYTVSKKGTVRALHFQRVRQQPKLVRCISGRVWDVVVDLRPASPSFRKWESFELTGENRRELLIPGGCAHGYLVLETSIVSYKCSEPFVAEYDDGVRWDDPDLAVAWPLDLVGGPAGVILSDKDRNLPAFAEFMRRHGGLK
jgi:dTDP-4-dehydrorhamnose 3,5-epimerase